jgi:polyferredoxin
MRYDLTRLPLLKPLLRSRWPQLLFQLIALGGFVLAILAGLVGTPVGNHNFSIVFVWIAWWALLMLIAVPFFGRGWCSICPIPIPGEWLQRGAVLKPAGRGPSAGSGRGLSWGRRWPNRLRNIWLQNGAFALVALFSAVVLTQPRVTGIMLAAFLFIAVGTSLIFERRAFCRYLCPVGGFIGLYSQLAPVEVRVKDPALCVAHTPKTCYLGSDDGYGCPWQVFPGRLMKNTYCGMCGECLRTCPYDNVTVNLRPFGADLQHPTGRRLDEAFKAFILLGSVLAYSAVMLGPWGALKSAAYAVGTAAWLGYALTFLSLIFGLLPGLFWIAVRAGQVFARSNTPTRQTFIAFAYALIPLGLAAWIAFSLAFVFANLSYLWPVLSDPFGWGWNLFGTTSMAWTPYLTRVVPALQTLALLGGLMWASATVHQIAGEQSPSVGHAAGLSQSLPVILFCLLVTLALLGLLVG